MPGVTYRSRLDDHKAAGLQPAYPPNPAPWIIDRLMEIGPTEAAGMGRGPISWREIRAYAEVTASRIRPWEGKLLRRLSAAWLAECHRAEHPHAAAPYYGEATPDRRQMEEDALRRVLG